MTLFYRSVSSISWNNCVTCLCWCLQQFLIRLQASENWCFVFRGVFTEHAQNHTRAYSFLPVSAAQFPPYAFMADCISIGTFWAHCLTKLSFFKFVNKKWTFIHKLNHSCNFYGLSLKLFSLNFAFITAKYGRFHFILMGYTFYISTALRSFYTVHLKL